MNAFIKEKDPGEQLGSLSLSTWISQSPELWEINVCRLSYPVCSILLQYLTVTKTITTHGKGTLQM